jgi:hypothetical protein
MVIYVYIGIGLGHDDKDSKYSWSYPVAKIRGNGLTDPLIKKQFGSMRILNWILKNYIYNKNFTKHRKDSPKRQEQGCQIFLGTTYQNGKNIPKLPQNIPNDHKI